MKTFHKRNLECLESINKKWFLSADSSAMVYMEFNYIYASSLPFEVRRKSSLCQGILIKINCELQIITCSLREDYVTTKSEIFSVFIRFLLLRFSLPVFIGLNLLI